MNHDRAGMSANDRAMAVFDDWRKADSRSDTLEQYIEQAINAAVRDRTEQIAEAFSVGTSETHQRIHPQTVADRIRMTWK